MTTDEARAALLEAILYHNSDCRGSWLDDFNAVKRELSAFEAAIRAEMRDGYAQGMMDGIIEGQRDAEAELAAVREAAARAERDCRTFIDGTFDRTQENMARSALDALRAALAATPAEEVADKV